MKFFITKNIGIIAIIISIFSASIIVYRPQPAHAQIVEDLITELEAGLDYVENELGAVSGDVTAVEQTSETLQDTVLDKIAVAVAKELLEQVTNDVVSWIDSGFNGNPAFIQNPTAFFENIGDQATAQFISSNGALSSLCSPFSLQVRVAIAQQQIQNNANSNGNNQSQYSCTLSSAIQNVTNGAGSMQGFLGGDFSQGGWSAWESLTMQPQNNPNGAYLMAEDQLQQKIASQDSDKQSQLTQGGGFLSWETCTPIANSNDNSGYGAAYNNISGEDNNVYDGDAYNTNEENNSSDDCEIQTPGSVISAALNKHLGVPTDELLLANSVNDIISDLFTSLITTTLQDGLASLTKSNSGSGGAGSYLQQLANSTGTSSASFQSAQQTTLQAVSGYLNIEAQVAQNYDSAAALVSTATTTIDQANTCYQNALTQLQSATSTTSASSSAAAIAYIQYQIGATQYEEATITPIVGNIMSLDDQADQNFNQFSTIAMQVQNAQSLSDLQQPSQELQTVVQSGPPVQTDVTQSRQNLDTYQKQITPIQNAANTLLSECLSFDPDNSATFVMFTYGSGSTITTTSSTTAQ